MVKKAFLWLGVFLLVIVAARICFSGAGSSGVPVRAVGDLDGDGLPEQYLLTDDCLTVTEGEQNLWQSPPDWCVDNFALGDADNDGIVNLAITLWKKGSFGAMRPFWQSGADVSYKNHLFVFKVQDNCLKPVWCSSDLDHPILSFRVRDVDGDGLNELVVEEGRYRKAAGERYTLDPTALGRTTIWQWEEWGFRLNDDV